MADNITLVDESRFSVYSFSRQPSGDEIIIGRPDAGLFVALPPEAVEVLDDLAAGRTVGETRTLYVQRHGEIPDLADFLGLMTQKAFVYPLHGKGEVETSTFASPVEQRKYHFENLPDGVARFFFGPPAISLYVLIIAAGAWVAFCEPSIVPGRKALYFQQFHTPKILGVVAFSFVTLFFHEMSHLLAARAVGIKSRLGIGHRLWVVVAETDLTGLWAVPKRNRYLPLLAGPLTDLATAAAILLVLYSESHGWIALPPLALEMIRAIFFAYVLQITWQFFFFVRTDLYYVLTTLLNCKNLMGDTEIFLKNQLARLLQSTQVVDQSHIPSGERTMIRLYSIVWLLGRAVAVFLLLMVTLPLTFSYFLKIGSVLRNGYAADFGAFLDAVMSVVLFLAFFAIGVGLWLRSLIRQWKSQTPVGQVSQ